MPVRQSAECRQHYTTSGHNYSVLNSVPVNICIMLHSVIASSFLHFLQQCIKLAFRPVFHRKFANKLCEPYPLKKCKFFISALSSSLKCMPFSSFNVMKGKFLFICKFCLLVTLNGIVSKMKV